MDLLVPRPQPDQLLSSIWLQYSRRTGVPIRALTRLHFGAKWAPSFFGCGYLLPTAALLGMSPARVLQEHTLFPYLTAFYPRQTLFSALESALSTGVHARKSGPVTQSASDLVRSRRLCPQCVREQLVRLGFSYWTRSANLPGVCICLKHQCSIEETELPTAGPRGWTDLMPHEVRVARRLTARITEAQKVFAELSTELLSRRFEESSSRNGEWYRSALEEVGAIGPKRDISSQGLVAFVAHQLKRTPTYWDLRPADRRFSWAALMVRPSNTQPVPTIKHLLFSTALQLALGGAKDDIAHRPSGCKPQDWSRLDRQAARTIASLTRRCERAGTTLRVQDALAAAGAWQQFRHGRNRFPLSLAAIAELKISPAGCRKPRG